MNKAELIDELTQRLGADREQATDALENMLDTIVRAVHGGDSVTTPGSASSSSAAGRRCSVRAHSSKPWFLRRSASRRKSQQQNVVWA